MSLPVVQRLGREVRAGEHNPPIADAHADGQRSTADVPMVGDPWMDHVFGGLGTRRACRYAAEMARKAGLLAGDLSRLDAHLVGPSTVVFTAADASQREIARFTIPDRVITFDPSRKPLRLADQRDQL